MTGDTVSRPGGSTPRGLPWPGNAAVHASTPAALQSLAEAVTAQLGALPGGMIFDTFVGNLTTGQHSGHQTGRLQVPFPKLSSILGCVASYGTFAGGAEVKGWMQADYFKPGWFYVVPAQNQRFDQLETAYQKTFSVCALGWGPPA